MGKRAKTIIAVILVCTLSITAPLQSYRIESRAVVAEAVVIGAASVALMALAAFGVSYLVQGATAQETKDYIDTKIIEFKQYSGNSNFPGENPNDYKISPLGKIILSVNAARIVVDFVNWMKSGKTQGQTTEVIPSSDFISFGEYDIPLMHLNETLNRVPIESYPSLYDYVSQYNYDFYSDYSVGDTEYLYNENGKYIYFKIISAGSNSYNIGNYYTNDSGGEGGNSNAVIMNPQGFDEYRWFVVEDIGNKYYLSSIGLYGGKFQTLALSSGNYAEWLKNMEVTTQGGLTEKVENTDTLPDLSNAGADDGLELDNPGDAPTTAPDANNVPVPLPAADIFNNIFNSIEGNTENVTNYNPTYNIINNYSEQADINTDEYDEPLPEPEPEPMPDTGTVGEATSLIQEIYEWFIGLFPWDRMKTKFPFSIPYDMYLIGSGMTGNEYDVLGGTLPTVTGDSVNRKANTAPVYTLSVPWGNNRTFTLVLDFSIVDPIRPIIRAGVGILFTAVLFLML